MKFSNNEVKFMGNSKLFIDTFFQKKIQFNKNHFLSINSRIVTWLMIAYNKNNIGRVAHGAIFEYQTRGLNW